MSKQVTYQFSSTNDRTITMRGILVREGVVSVNAPPVYNTTFLAQARQFRPRLLQTGIDINETVLTQYAKDHGYTLTKSVKGDSSSTTLNTPLAAAPTLAVAAAASGTNNLSWTGSLRMEIWESRNSNQNFMKVATMGSGGTSYADTANIVGETYYYKVRITDGTKVGAFSNEVSVVATA